jgi:hypothetical protein
MTVVQYHVLLQERGVLHHDLQRHDVRYQARLSLEVLGLLAT